MAFSDERRCSPSASLTSGAADVQSFCSSLRLLTLTTLPALAPLLLTLLLAVLPTSPSSAPSSPPISLPLRAHSLLPLPPIP